MAVFYFWPALLPTLAALPFIWRDYKVRFSLAAILLMYLGLTLEIWPMTQHYHAPVTAVTVLLLIQAMRFWNTKELYGRRAGAAVARSIPLFCAGMLAFRLSAAVFHVPVPEHALAPWFTVTSGNLDRARIAQFLEAQPGNQLVFVRYSATHHTDEEWVHNAADVENSKVVWARDAGRDDNASLTACYPGRRQWTLDADQKPPRLTPLSTRTQ